MAVQEYGLKKTRMFVKPVSVDTIFFALTHPKCTKECQSTHLLNPKVVQCFSGFRRGSVHAINNAILDSKPKPLQSALHIQSLMSQCGLGRTQ